MVNGSAYLERSTISRRNEKSGVGLPICSNPTAIGFETSFTRPNLASFPPLADRNVNMSGATDRGFEDSNHNALPHAEDLFLATNKPWA